MFRLTEQELLSKLEAPVAHAKAFQLNDTALHQLFMLKKVEPMDMIELHYAQLVDGVAALSIQQQVAINAHYTRSINLERDSSSMEVLKAYVPTSRATNLGRVAIPCMTVLLREHGLWSPVRVW